MTRIDIPDACLSVSDNNGGMSKQIDRNRMPWRTGARIMSYNALQILRKIQ